MRPAIGDIRTILWTKKTEYVKASKHKILVLYGSTGNGKSMIATLKFISRVFNSAKHEQTFILAGKDITTLEKRFIDSNYSVFNWKPFKGKWVYKKLGVGGSKMIVETKTGKKNIYFTPFNNVGAYSRILGSTINGVMVDEAVEGDEMFLNEILGRIIRTQGSWGIFTSNGGDVDHFFYTHICNKCVRVDELIDGVYETPPEEVRYFDEDRNEDWLYMHMRLEDNPSYTKEQLETFYTLYPSGSFMYYSRVLGIRGFSMDSPFSSYMQDVWVKENELGVFYPNKIVFSVDVGGHVFSRKELPESEYVDGAYGTNKGGHTILVVGGFSNDYKRFTLLDTYFPNHMHTNINVERIQEKVYNISERFPRGRRLYMFSDPADPSMLAMLRDRIVGVDGIMGETKRDNSINMEEKVIITLIQQYMMNGNFKMVDNEANRKWAYNSLVSATLEKDGKLKDNGSWEADFQDGLKYIFSSMYRLLPKDGVSI